MLSGVVQKCVEYNVRFWAFGFLTVYALLLRRKHMIWPVQFALLRPPAISFMQHTLSLFNYALPCALLAAAARRAFGARRAPQGQDCARSSSNRRLTAHDDASAGRCLSTSLRRMSRAALGAQCCCWKLFRAGQQSTLEIAAAAVWVLRFACRRFVRMALCIKNNCLSSIE